MKWYCFRTHSKRERLAANNVRRRLHVDVFCPAISQMRRTRVGRRRFTEAMFPCYAFARIDLNSHLLDLKHTCGVESVLRLGARYPAVPPGFVSDLRDRLNEDEILWVADTKPRLQTVVTVDDGPFRNFVGRIVSAANGCERICVLLDILGRQVEVQINRAQVSPAEDSEYGP